MSMMVGTSGLRTSEKLVKARNLESGMNVWNQGQVIEAVWRSGRMDVTFGHGTFAYDADEPVLLDG